jgi:hypothetical protein
VLESYFARFLLLLNYMTFIVSEQLYFLLEGLTDRPFISLVITSTLAFLVLYFTPDLVIASAKEEVEVPSDFELKYFDKAVGPLHLTIGVLVFTVFNAIFIVPQTFAITAAPSFGIPSWLAASVFLLATLLVIALDARKEDGSIFLDVFYANPFFYLKGYRVYYVEYMVDDVRIVPAPAGPSTTRYRRLVRAKGWIFVLTTLELEEEDFKNAAGAKLYYVAKHLFVA